MALDLVKGFSTKSFVSKRLWKTIKGLKEVGPKLGLSPNDVLSQEEDPHSSAALAMAGLAGHEISGMGFGENINGSGNTGGEGSPMNGFQMSNEMTSLFEAALGSIGATNNNTNSNSRAANGGHGHGYVQDVDGMAGVGSNVFGGDEELYKQLRDLF